MSDSLSGKVALITGGGTGLGAAVARRFAAKGVSVVLTGRREGPIKEIAEEVGGRAMAGDVTDSVHLSNVVKTAVESYGGLDIVIANAGIISMADAVSVTDQDWEQVIDINLTGVMKTAKSAVPALIKRGGGSIVNISSIAGLMGVTEGAGYCTSKAALMGLTRSLAIDFGPKGVRVNTLCPGWFRSEMSEMEMEELAKEKKITVEEAVRRVTRYLPLKRMASPDEIAACVEFLASDNASFVTGTVLVADGGGAIVDVGMLGFL